MGEEGFRKLQLNLMITLHRRQKITSHIITFPSSGQPCYMFKAINKLINVKMTKFTYQNYPYMRLKSITSSQAEYQIQG